MKDRGNFIYKFGGGHNEGSLARKDIFGGKGANLFEMSSIGLPVPPGFTVSAEVCNYYNKHEVEWPDGLNKKIHGSIKYIEKLTGQDLGDNKNPRLVSARSGAAVSMPGMMDTILNLGLNDKTVKGLANKNGQ